jgi:hypothetical protein
MAPETGNHLAAPWIPGLTPEEQTYVTRLAGRLALQTNYINTRFMYYDGTQLHANLGVSVPQILSNVRTVVDWARGTIDPLIQGAVPDGFRLAGATDIDDELAEHWAANNMDAEIPLAFLDSLVAGRGFGVVGSPDEPGDSPIITVESPKNMSLVWDPRTKRTKAAYQAYEVEGVFRSVLYLPNVNVKMSRDMTTATSFWTIDDRDEHNFGQVSVVRLANRARTADREGRSEITAPIMNTIDSASRSLLGMEIAREFYSIPHRYILGASESDYVDAAGNPKTPLEMSMNKFLAFERDEEGQTPTVGQFTAFDPSVFTRIIDTHAQLMSSYTGYPPSYFGQTTSANPASGDAIVEAKDGLVSRRRQVQKQWTAPMREIGQLVWRFANGGKELPDPVKKMAVDWIDAAPSTPAATTDAISKQISSGSVPATSDVTLARLGYTANERERLEIDRRVDVGAQVLAELSGSVAVKEARVGTSVAHELSGAAAPVKAPTTPTPAPPPVPTP